MTREQAIAALTQIPIDLARKAIRRVCAVEGGDPGQGVRYEIDHAWAEKFWAVQDVLDAKAPVQVAAYLEILEALCHPAPSPDPGERPDVAWATQQRVHDLVYALDCIALHAAGEPTDPAEACRLIWKVADAARQPPAPSPAEAPPLGDWEAHDERWGLLAAEPKRPCTGCGVPLSNNTVLTGRPCAMCGHPQPEKEEETP